MAKVVIFGTAELARLMRFYLTHDSPHEVVAWTVDGAFLRESSHEGLPVVAFEDLLDVYPPGDHLLFVAVGVTRVNRMRAERVAQAREKGYDLVSFVSSRAIVWPDLRVGANTAIMEGCIIQPFARVGDGVTVGPGTTIGHDGDIGDHVFIGLRASLSGDVVVEPYAILGANCTVRDRVRIARSSVVGAGVTIHRDTEVGGVYVGPRAERLRLPSDKLPRI